MGRTEFLTPMIFSEPRLESANPQRERDRALLRVHAAVCSENLLTPPTLLERRFNDNQLPLSSAPETILGRNQPQSLFKWCHDYKTAKYDGGFGRAPSAIPE
jgi:hypothetical protein